MKKLLAVTLVLCMMVPCFANAAVAVKPDFFVTLYNIARQLCGGIEISMETAIETHGKEHTFHWETPNEKLILIVNASGDLSGVVVVGDRLSRNFLPMCYCSLMAASVESMKEEDWKDIMISYFLSLKDEHFIGSFKNNINYQYMFRDDDNVLNIYLN